MYLCQKIISECFELVKLCDINCSGHPDRSFPFVATIYLGVSKGGVKKGVPVDHFWPLRRIFLPFDPRICRKL